MSICNQGVRWVTLAGRPSGAKWSSTAGGTMKGEWGEHNKLNYRRIHRWIPPKYSTWPSVYGPYPVNLSA